ncbi:MAG: molybdopterin-dependent oxidoreductase [Dehalococcoidia bacterium]
MANTISDVEIKRSHCAMCGQHCGMEVFVNNGEIVKIVGDKNSSSKGFRCERNTLGALDYHNHPSRVNYPLKRVGARGEGKWQRISWQQAMDEVAQKISNIREKYGPEALAIMAGSGTANYGWLDVRWANLFGTPNRFFSSMNCFAPKGIVHCAMYGSDATGSPQRGVTKCIVFFSGNKKHSRPSTWKTIVDTKEQGAKIIVVDPRLTELAKIADIWLQIRPGTDAALAYGMLNIIIQENLYDKEFVQQWCLDFEKVKSCVRKYTPEVVEEITWISREKIIEAARTYATSKPALIEPSIDVSHSHLGGDPVLQSNLAKCALRAITGNLDVKGGDVMRDTNQASSLNYDDNMHWDKLINHPMRKRDSLSAEKFPISSVEGFALLRESMAKPNGKVDFIADWCFSPMASPHYIWQAILDEKPYPLKALIIDGLSLMCSRTNTRKIYAALKSDNLDISVVMDQFMRPEAMLADYVLPATDWFEVSWLDLVRNQTSEQAVTPKFERKSMYYFLRELGIRLGQEEYWPNTLEEMYDYIIRPRGLKFQEFSSHAPTARYKKYETDGFRTHSGKVELAPSLLKKLGYELWTPFKEPPRTPVSAPELAKKYPLILITGARTITFFHSTLREIAKLRAHHPDPLVQIHPDTARENGIADGDWVYIETPEGRIKQRAEVTKIIHPKVVGIEHAWSFPEQSGEDPNLFGIWESTAGVILPDDPELCDFQGGPPLRALLCKIYRV